MLVNEIWRVGKAYFWTLNLGFNSVLVRVVSNFSSDSLQERKWVYFLKCQSLPLQFTWCAHVHLTTIVQCFPSSKFTSLSSSFSSTNVTNALMLKGKNSVLPHFGALRKIIFLGCAHIERINQGAGESRNKSHVHWGAKGTGTHCFSEIKKKKKWWNWEFLLWIFMDGPSQPTCKCGPGGHPQLKKSCCNPFLIITWAQQPAACLCFIPIPPSHPLLCVEKSVFSFTDLSHCKD